MISVVGTIVGCLVCFGLGYWLSKTLTTEVVDSLIVYSLSQEEVIKQQDLIKAKQLELIQAYQERVEELEAIQ